MSKALTLSMEDSRTLLVRRLLERKLLVTQNAKSTGLAGKAGEIAAVLEDRMMTGVYRFGEALSIYALAEQFGTSRQPVASAINHLRSSGYLEVIPQVGCRVVSPSPQEIDDFYHMYGKVEGVLSSLAAQRHEGDEAEILIEIEKQVEPVAFASLEERRVLKAGIIAFHEQISAMARAPTLASRIDGLRRVSFFYIWQGRAEFRPKVLKYTNSMRSRLARAIAARDAEAAELLTEQHIRAKPRKIGIIGKVSGL